MAAIGCYPTRDDSLPSSAIAKSIVAHGSPDFPPMHAREIITPDANRPSSCLQPKRYGTEEVRRVSVCFPDDAEAVAAEFDWLGFAA